LEYLKNEDNGKPCLILLELNMPKMNGIEFTDEVPWGTHLCQFYQSKEDLIEILVPYFKQGLENNEFCMWVTSEPLGVEDAKTALKEKVKNLDDYIRKGQIEILDYKQWYTVTGRFEADKVLEGWVEKEKQAIEKGFDGLRLTGNTSWLKKKDWQSFADYEAVVDSIIGKHRMLAICSYSLDRCQAREVIDVVNNHQFALIRKEGKWTPLESSERKSVQVKLQQHIKHLDCLYGLSKLAVRPQISLDQIFRETTELVRSAYRYPDITCVRITFNGIQYKTDNFQKSEISQHADIMVRREKTGSIEVYCLQERREDEEGTFLKEEGALLGAVCEKLGRIAELKQTTDKLRLFRTLIDQSNDCIFILEPKWGRFLDVNDRACESLRYSRKELLEMSIKDIEEFPEGFSWQQQIEELKLKGDITIQGRHKCKDGTRFFAETSLKFVKEEKEDYLIAIARDITARKKAEEALWESQERYRALAENTVLGITIMDTNYKIIMINEMVAKLFNRPASSFVGKYCFREYEKREAVCSHCPGTRSMASGKTEEVETKGVRDDGNCFYVRNRAIPHFGSDGVIKGFIEIIEDITERKKAEEAQKQLVAIIEATSDFVGFADAKDKHIIYVNKAGRKMCGIGNDEDVTKLKICDVHPEWTNKMLAEEILPAAARDGIWTGECAFLDIRDRHEIPVLMVLSSHKAPNGEVEVFSTISRDITERKRTEEKQAELVKEIESVNKELKDFAYIVSHDLKAPLRGVKTIAGWLSADYADKFDENGNQQLNLLISRVDRMNNLINGVLEYSRVGRVQENRAVVDLNKLVPEIIDMIAPPENISITVENELPTIQCEPTRIMQVFQNLLSNAVKFMDKPQGQVKVGCMEEDGFWKFSVADNGPGIEERHFEKIFQIFQTLSPQDKVESTGIGLTVAKKIVELYDGKIWVESKVGEGSTFFFTLPKQKVGVKDAQLQTNIAY
jgi:PAS domain S-box-containing protein